MPTRNANTRQRSAGVFLLRSAIFLIVLVLLGAVFQKPLSSGFYANIYLNGTILVMFAVGILYTLQALIGVYMDTRAIGRAVEVVATARRDARPVQQVNEVLLSPSRRGVSEFLNTAYRVVQHSDTATTLPYLLDSLAARGEDRRALVRYLTGGLVMLGLIGTFYGLLITIGGVREVIGSISGQPSTDTVALLAGLKERLAVPLSGMSTAFSSSLFGLLGSLALAFLELQLFHALNDSHARLESLVVSDLLPLWQTPGKAKLVAASQSNLDPRYQVGLLQATVERLDKVAGLIESVARSKDGGQRVAEQMAALAERIESLRETLETVERDRTADLRHELRAIVHTLHEPAFNKPATSDSGASHAAKA